MDASGHTPDRSPSIRIPRPPENGPRPFQRFAERITKVACACLLGILSGTTGSATAVPSTLDELATAIDAKRGFNHSLSGGIGRIVYCLKRTPGPKDQQLSDRRDKMIQAIEKGRITVTLAPADDDRSNKTQGVQNGTIGGNIRMTAQHLTDPWNPKLWANIDRIPTGDEVGDDPGWPAFQKAFIHELAHAAGHKQHEDQGWLDIEDFLWKTWLKCSEIDLGDFGDADPERYPTPLLWTTISEPMEVLYWKSQVAKLGAHHLVTDIAWLGKDVNREDDPAKTDAHDDGIEGGIVLSPDRRGKIEVRVSVAESVPRGDRDKLALRGWIDWDGRGKWDRSDEELTWLSVQGAGAEVESDDETVVIDPSQWSALTARLELEFKTPQTDKVSRKGWARFRLYSLAKQRELRTYVEPLDKPRFEPTGPALFGEVEDYRLGAGDFPVKIAVGPDAESFDDLAVLEGRGVAAGEVFTARARNPYGWPMALSAPLGTVFSPNKRRFQRIMIGRDHETRVAPEGDSTTHWTGYCLDPEKKPPATPDEAPKLRYRADDRVTKSEARLYEEAEAIIRAGNRLAEGGRLGMSGVGREDIIQWAIWHHIAPKDHGERELRRTIRQSLREGDEAGGRKRVKELSQQVWALVEEILTEADLE